ncbi:nicotinamide-nucleotide amidohydrolase family protein [Mycoplasmatota bacterium WC44]
MEKQLVELLTKMKLKIATAESCTGGLLSAAIINVNGASSVIDESHVTYSNEAKMKYLRVSEDTLDKFGAVSEECALEMASGVKELANSDIGVSITGIAGPGGGTVEKPVGLVYIGISFKDSLAHKHIFSGSRDEVRKQSVEMAISHILKELHK